MPHHRPDLRSTTGARRIAYARWEPCCRETSPWVSAFGVDPWRLRAAITRHFRLPEAKQNTQRCCVGTGTREKLLSGSDRRLGRGRVRRVYIATPRANIFSPCLMPKHDLRRKRATANAITQLFRKLGFRRLQRRFRKRDLLFQLRLVRRRWQLSADLIEQAQYRSGSAKVVSPFGCHHITFPAHRALSRHLHGVNHSAT